MKYIKEFKQHPLDIIWVTDSDHLNLYVAGDQRNIDLGLEVGSMLVKIGNQRVAGESMQSLNLKLRRVKDFPLSLQFLKQPHLQQEWAQAQEFRSNGKSFYSEKKFAEALLEYDKAIERHPTLKYLHSNKVLCLLKLEKFEMALQASHEMLILDPYFAKGHYLKGVCHLHVGEVSESVNDRSIHLAHAVTELRTTLKKQPANQAAQEKLQLAEKQLEVVKAEVKAEMEAQIKKRKEEREAALKQYKAAFGPNPGEAGTGEAGAAPLQEAVADSAGDEPGEQPAEDKNMKETASDSPEEVTEFVAGPSEQSIIGASEEPMVEAPSDAPAEPADARSEDPVAQPADVPAVQPAEAPAVQPAEVPPADVPAAQPEEAPLVQPAEAEEAPRAVPLMLEELDEEMAPPLECGEADTTQSDATSAEPQSKEMTDEVSNEEADSKQVEV